MKYKVLFLYFIISCTYTNGQSSSNPTFFQGGITVNFLYSRDRTYHGPLGSVTDYDIKALIPLPGFILGFHRDVRVANNVFARLGGSLSYHVTSAVINSESRLGGYKISESIDIKTRFRNLYFQVPLQAGLRFGKTKSQYVITGLKFDFLVVNGNTWQYHETKYNYNFSVHPPEYINTTGPTEEKTKLATNKLNMFL